MPNFDRYKTQYANLLLANHHSAATTLPPLRKPGIPGDSGFRHVLSNNGHLLASIVFLSFFCKEKICSGVLLIFPPAGLLLP